MPNENSVNQLLKMKAKQKEENKQRILELLKFGEKTIYEICSKSQLRQTRRILAELEEEDKIVKNKRCGKGQRSTYRLP